jgi:hypothetical protein
MPAYSTAAMAASNKLSSAWRSVSPEFQTGMKRIVFLAIAEPTGGSKTICVVRAKPFFARCLANSE